MKRLLVVQYAGDYRQAWRQIAESGTENYQAHRYVLDSMAGLARDHGAAGLLCCRTEERYSEVLPNGVTVIGGAASADRDWRDIAGLIEAFAPTHLVLHGPMTRLLAWTLQRPWRLACIFADSFEISWLRRRLIYGALPALLNRPKVEWVANHGENACRSLRAIGVDPAKIRVWDFPHDRKPHDLPPRTGPGDPPYVMLYVGALLASKGVGDLIRAVALLRGRGLPVEARIVGGGDRARFEALARRCGIAGHVHFTGTLPNAQVAEEMRRAALVAVPSRHSYPEGFPLTVYEALCSRTPIVASDHPMFAGHLVDGRTATVHAERNPRSLALTAERLLTDAPLYEALSRAAPACWEGLQTDRKWGDLLADWLSCDNGAAAGGDAKTG
ncbi:hypothetical protein GCM10007897_39970 [Sphingobium jiangsuense]|uniref:Glycosyltransferase involved in cell wall biosynthesis n=1 Tax=Sphingobium jiangsuense TaxID=870476 RepID=A0A7W6FNK3_9SPHN|nr:glycosyltransferase family 4 protein [Sphingobium jiangsuense]MBB3924840.1 glycosyltransferase involved in cell wall biosynthesis [Sphingobium jiangsuense]GLT02581.1 hypothetical protein GCM10007897_39970 [Sphingobium jiangsuense]